MALTVGILHRYNRLSYFLSPLAALGGTLGAIPSGRAPKKHAENDENPLELGVAWFQTNP